MTTEIDTPKTFQERMKERIKKDIGELITDEELSELIKRGIDEVFFKETVIDTGSWNNKKVIPALMHSVVKELLTERVTKEVSDYFNNNPKVIAEVVETTLREGAGRAVLAAITNMFSQDLLTMQNNLINKLQNTVR